jgi:CDP-diacylglycerol---glycerol-3-phosphate 3-phosphatidyltransferase
MNNIKAWFRGRMLAVGGFVARTGISPNAISIITLGLNAIVAGIIAAGYLLPGGVLILLVGLLDSLDGAVARASGQATTFGAFLDSTLDRYAEAVLFLAIVYYYRADTTVVLLSFIALVGSVLVSYARARAEGLGLDCEVGWLARPERVFVLGIGLAGAQYSLYALLIALSVLAFFTHVTAIQRIWHIYRLTDGK